MTIVDSLVPLMHHDPGRSWISLILIQITPKGISTSENSGDINISRSRNIRTNPLICLVLFSLITARHFLVLMLMSSARITSENSTRQISGFVLLMFQLMLMFTSALFSLELILMLVLKLQ